jgi:hypothetical protein
MMNLWVHLKKWLHAANISLTSFRMLGRDVFVDDIPGGNAMNIPKKDITVALVNHTREIIMAQRAIFVAATIKIATMMVVLIFAGLVVLFHAMYA